MVKAVDYLGQRSRVTVKTYQLVLETLFKGLLWMGEENHSIGLQNAELRPTVGNCKVASVESGKKNSVFQQLKNNNLGCLSQN